jgi:hypothetical protein
MIIQHLDYAALVIGTLGTLLWAHNGRNAKYAAPCWIASSLLWIGFAWASGLPALGMRDFLSVCLYAYGGWRWLRPRAAVPS